jgi:hypothetical protein
MTRTDRAEPPDSPECHRARPDKRANLACAPLTRAAPGRNKGRRKPSATRLPQAPPLLERPLSLSNRTDRAA